MPLHIFHKNEIKTFNVNFSVFILRNQGATSFLLVENFLEDRFFVEIDAIEFENSNFKLLHSHASTYMCYAFKHPYEFRDAIEATMTTSYKAIHELGQDIELLHGLLN